MATTSPASAVPAVVTPIKSKNTNTVALNPAIATQQRLVLYFNNCLRFLDNNFNLRQTFLQADLAYNREKSKTVSGRRAEVANATGDGKAQQDVVIPVVMPQVETAVTYFTDTFLTSYPIFPVLSKPDQQDAALQMETAVGEQSVRYGWPAQLMLAFRDGLKYNLMAVEVCWRATKIWTIESDTGSTTQAAKAPVDTYYEGNYLRRLSPYNLILDTRVEDPSEMHKKGEFIGYTELMNRINLKQLFVDLGQISTMNAKDAFESGGASYSSVAGNADYYIPMVNPLSFNTVNRGLTSTDWMSWAGLESKDGIKYKDMYEVSTLYCRIIPNDFDLNVQSRNNVQIWKLIVVNRKVLIFCERQTNAHNYLPIILAQPNGDGLGWQTKSFAENAAPMQDAATSLFTAGMESQRRKVFDRIFYDPSRINKKDIDNTSPVARIPVKQSAYGTVLEQAIYSAPYHDEGVPLILQMSQQVAEMAFQVNGQNRAQQGQFQKGNKSRKEFDTIMGNANGRQQTTALYLEYVFFQPVKEIIKLNILQFQPPTTLYNRNTKSPVQINPNDIRAAALEFRLADGVLPVDKLINVDAIGQVMQMSASNPVIGSEYDLVGMMMYALTLSGASWINDFKRTPQQQQAFVQNLQSAQGVTNAAGQPVAPTSTQPQPTSGS